MDSLILGIVVALFVWLFMRRRRITMEQRARAAQASADGAPAEAQSMPRVGRPGTITREQIKALRAYDFEPSRMWSKEEADLILDSVAYLREAIRETTGEADAPLDVQNKVLAFILTDEELRTHILELRRNMTRADEARGIPPRPRDEKFDRVMNCVRELWED